MLWLGEIFEKRLFWADGTPSTKASVYLDYFRNSSILDVLEWREWKEMSSEGQLGVTS